MGHSLDGDEPPIPMARPSLGEEEARAAAAVVRSGWLLQGPEVEALEGELAAALSAPHACAVSSGTAALHLALCALGVGPGDEVVTVSHSFIATANCVALTGAQPVFVDIEPRGFNLDPARLAAAIGPRTRAVLCVHQLGMPCALEPILAVTDAHGLPLVEDAACAMGSELAFGGAWERVGRPRGALACFSFHPRKLLTAGEGGAVVSARPELDRAVRTLRQHGSPDGRSFERVGFNYRLTDLAAAVLRPQLRRLPELVAERRRLADGYRQRLAGIAGLALPEEPAWARSNWQSFCVRVPDGAQARILDGLAARKIAARTGCQNAHQQPAWAGSHAAASLPESERAAASTVCLPIFGGMSERELDRVAAALAALVA